MGHRRELLARQVVAVVDAGAVAADARLVLGVDLRVQVNVEPAVPVVRVDAMDVRQLARNLQVPIMFATVLVAVRGLVLLLVGRDVLAHVAVARLDVRERVKAALVAPVVVVRVVKVVMGALVPVQVVMGVLVDAKDVLGVGKRAKPHVLQYAKEIALELAHRLATQDAAQPAQRVAEITVKADALRIAPADVRDASEDVLDALEVA